LGELDGIVLEFLKDSVVQVIESIVREVIHGRKCPMDDIFLRVRPQTAPPKVM
jgi:hypothetical protein